MTIKNDPVKFKELHFSDLFQVSGLERLDQRFLQTLKENNPELQKRLLAYRQADAPLPPVETSELLLALAPFAEKTIAQLFGIEQELTSSQTTTLSHDVVLEFKKSFVLRRARRYRGEITQTFDELDNWLSAQLHSAQPDNSDRELSIAGFGQTLLANETGEEARIEKLTQWCVLALNDMAGRKAVTGWTSFKLPDRIDHARLVPFRRSEQHGVEIFTCDPSSLHRRDGFKLTDPRMPPRAVQGEINYCIYCHDKDGDFCSKGFPEKKGQPELGLKVDPLGVTLTGCPLEEKISEMHVLKRDGHTIAALAMAMVDNPMVPATGHRICNDCMKGCIYQKQDPVNIPQIETRVLTDVLALPWGVEIYDLLTRWNPLRQRQYLPQPFNGRKVLVAGMGPAGFTMAHHLTMEGCAVVGIDGLKIEPLPEDILRQPVRNWSDLVET